MNERNIKFVVVSNSFNNGLDSLDLETFFDSEKDALDWCEEQAKAYPYIDYFVCQVVYKVCGKIKIHTRKLK